MTLTLSPPSRRMRRRLILVLAAVLAAAGTMLGANTAMAATDLPCDIYGNAGTPCVAAYSPARALYSGYNGNLYEVTRASDGTTYNVAVLSTGGYANAAGQDAFCSGTTCTITKIYDQSPQHNDLTVAPAGSAGPANSPASATALPITVGGHAAYGIYLPPRTGYRRAVTTGIAKNGQPETIYEVASGTNVNNDCCSDFGNVESTSEDTGNGHMDTVTVSLIDYPGNGTAGPWVEADLENGVFQGGTPVNTANHGNPSKFVTALLKNNGQNTFALKGANAQSGALSTWYSGSLPSGYGPMHQEGSIVLGTGGDNSNRATESFFEGVMTAGYSTDAADNAVQANIVAAGYTGVSTGGGPGTTIAGPGGKCVDISGDDTGGNGAAAQLWTCLPLAADQHWSASALVTGTMNTLGRCLDIVGNGTAAGTLVWLWDCNGTGGQQWVPRADGTLYNPQSGRCLEAVGGGTSNGTSLQIANCTASASQQFRLTGGVPLIGPGGKCVDVSGDDNGVNTAVVQLWTCYSIYTDHAYAIDQHWTLNADGTLRTLGRCLDIVGNATAAGTHVQLYDCNGVGGQQWTVQSNGTLLNPQSGRCLDAVGGGTANGTLLQIANCTAAASQKFAVN